MPDHFEPMSEIARRVRQARSVAGWSQQDLAEHAGVSHPSVARIEAGEDVSTATLTKIVGALGLAVEVTDGNPGVKDE